MNRTPFCISLLGMKVCMVYKVGGCFGVLGLVIHINRANKNFVFSNRSPTELTYNYAGPLNSGFLVLRMAV